MFPIRVRVRVRMRANMNTFITKYERNQNCLKIAHTEHVSVLQFFAVFCSVLQCFAVFFSALSSNCTYCTADPTSSDIFLCSFQSFFQSSKFKLVGLLCHLPVKTDLRALTSSFGIDLWLRACSENVTAGRTGFTSQQAPAFHPSAKRRTPWHTHIHTYTHAQAYIEKTQGSAHYTTHTHTHAQRTAHIRTHTHTHAHIRARAHTHTHSLSLSLIHTHKHASDRHHQKTQAAKSEIVFIQRYSQQIIVYTSPPNRLLPHPHTTWNLNP